MKYENVVVRDYLTKLMAIANDSVLLRIKPAKSIINLRNTPSINSKLFESDQVSF